MRIELNAANMAAYGISPEIKFTANDCTRILKGHSNEKKKDWFVLEFDYPSPVMRSMLPCRVTAFKSPEVQLESLLGGTVEFGTHGKDDSEPFWMLKRAQVLVDVTETLCGAEEAD